MADGDGVVLTADEGDGPTVDGRPCGGEVGLGADPEAASPSRVAYEERWLVVLVREGAWGVRDFAPVVDVRRAFRGIEAMPYGPRWSVPWRCTPYGDRQQR
ncbi:hypothetical protein [Streptomyces sp. NPDC054940]